MSQSFPMTSRLSSFSVRPSRIVPAAIVSLTVFAVASCGSKTGLFGADGDLLLPEGGPGADVTVPTDAPPDTVPCVPGRFDFELATAQIMFVIDRSGSMDFSLNGNRNRPPGVPSRWEVLRDALLQTILPFDSQIGMGAKFYPEPLAFGDFGRACQVDVGVGIPPERGNTQAILDVFDQTEPRGGTPSAEAIRLAADYLAQRRTVARSIVLATDGAPNCNDGLNPNSCICTNAPPDICTTGGQCLDDARAIATIRDAAEVKKIPVYVIGIGSTERPEFLQVLDQMAVAGGRPRPSPPLHYNVQTATEMRAALSDIRDSVARCTYLTPSAPNHPDAIRVEIDGQPISRDPTGQNGWDWVDKDYGELTFFGEACERAQGSTPRITGVVSCEP
jgi:hypothetical protein